MEGMTPPMTSVPVQGPAPGYPPGVVVPATFFMVAGVLELVLSVWEIPAPRPFWPVWEALGRALAHWLLALGLWNRIALCRSIALVYCLGSIVVYLFALLLAYTGAPVRFPNYVVLQSLFQVPSCALLFHFLRSDRAGAIYTRPLI